jgi:hypothetical protein
VAEQLFKAIDNQNSDAAFAAVGIALTDWRERTAD